MGRNMQVKKKICSTQRMRVSDDESYSNRYGEFTSQGLNRGGSPMHSLRRRQLCVRKDEAEERDEPLQPPNDQSTRLHQKPTSR